MVIMPSAVPYAYMWNFPGETYIFCHTGIGDLRQWGWLRRLNHSWNVGLGISAVLRDFIHQLEVAHQAVCSPSVEPLKRRCLGVVRSSLEGDLRRLLTEACGGLRMAIIALQKTSDVVNEMIPLTNFSTVLMSVFVRFIRFISS